MALGHVLSLWRTRSCLLAHAARAHLGQAQASPGVISPSTPASLGLGLLSARLTPWEGCPSTRDSAALAWVCAAAVSSPREGSFELPAVFLCCTGFKPKAAAKGAFQPVRASGRLERVNKTFGYQCYIPNVLTIGQSFAFGFEYLLLCVEVKKTQVH